MNCEKRGFDSRLHLLLVYGVRCTLTDLEDGGRSVGPLRVCPLPVARRPQMCMCVDTGFDSRLSCCKQHSVVINGQQYNSHVLVAGRHMHEVHCNDECMCG